MLAFRNEYPLFPIPSAQIEKPVLGSKLSKFSNEKLLYFNPFHPFPEKRVK